MPRDDIKDAELYHKLLNLAGDYRDASDATVKLFWDDATYDACVAVGNRFYFDRSFDNAIEIAFQDLKSEKKG